MLAFDRASVRSRDLDGRLHIAVANICREGVDGYLGGEIPDWRSLGLEADRLYQMYRPADELRQATPSFNNLPILLRHHAVNAADPQPELVVGSTGTDAKWSAPFITNSLVIWTGAGIAGIETGEQRQISPGYRYVPVMEPGTADGVRYDGRMTQIVASHLALVPDGRQGPDVVVGDRTPRRFLVADAEPKRFVVPDWQPPRHVVPDATLRANADDFFTRFPAAAHIRVLSPWQ